MDVIVTLYFWVDFTDSEIVFQDHKSEPLTVRSHYFALPEPGCLRVRPSHMYILKEKYYNHKNTKRSSNQGLNYYKAIKGGFRIIKT